MLSTILVRGRHRFGLPGLVPVRHFVTVSQRSLLVRLLGFGRRPGRHHAALGLDVAERQAPALQAAAA